MREGAPTSARWGTRFPLISAFLCVLLLRSLFLCGVFGVVGIFGVVSLVWFLWCGVFGVVSLSTEGAMKIVLFNSGCGRKVLSLKVLFLKFLLNFVQRGDDVLVVGARGC